MNYQAALRSFALITHVPDRVSRWFGASPGGEGSNEGEHATKVVGMAVGAFERKAGAVTQSVGAVSARKKPPPGAEKETSTGNKHKVTSKNSDSDTPPA